MRTIIHRCGRLLHDAISFLSWLIFRAVLCLPTAAAVAYLVPWLWKNLFWILSIPLIGLCLAISIIGSLSLAIKITDPICGYADTMLYKAVCAQARRTQDFDTHEKLWSGLDSKHEDLANKFLLRLSQTARMNLEKDIPRLRFLRSRSGRYCEKFLKKSFTDQMSILEDRSAQGAWRLLSAIDILDPSRFGELLRSMDTDHIKEMLYFEPIPRRRAIINRLNLQIDISSDEKPYMAHDT